MVEYTRATDLAEEIDRLKAEKARLTNVVGNYRQHRDEDTVEIKRLQTENERLTIENTMLRGKVQQYYVAGNKMQEENERLSTALQAAANERYHRASQSESDALLIDGLTLLCDKWQRRALAAESREIETP